MGRVCDSARWALWGERLRQFSGSGLTVAEFCRQEQVSVPSFYQWKRRLLVAGNDAGRVLDDVVPGGARSSGELSADLKGKKPLAFVPVRVRQFSQVEVQLVNGVSLRLPAGDVESLKATILIAGQLPAAGSPSTGNQPARKQRNGKRAVGSC